MAHLWFQDRAGGWTPVPLVHGELGLTTSGPLTQRGQAVNNRPICPVVAVRRADRQEGQWILLSDGSLDTSVNGLALVLGMRVLADRDEILLSDAESAGGARYFFAAEELPRVQPFPHHNEPVHCPRCKQLIEPNTPAVQCPSPTCRLWHHGRDDLPCWSYYATCASPACDQPTRLSDFRWSPAGL